MFLGINSCSHQELDIRVENKILEAFGVSHAPSSTRTNTGPVYGFLTSFFSGGPVKLRSFGSTCSDDTSNVMCHYSIVMPSH
ncbi:hypothetical protein M514_16901 [Trichuris suis]|uniref:Uncharacterized protein n=1 Tax=Trichuris suis TaxID=68888 RepID=A0A085NMT3_9BILA|nr:hypothetical protein M514_16901 [Trichuris suis]